MIKFCTQGRGEQKKKKKKNTEGMIVFIFFILCESANNFSAEKRVSVLSKEFSSTFPSSGKVWKGFSQVMSFGMIFQKRFFWKCFLARSSSGKDFFLEMSSSDMVFFWKGFFLQCLLAKFSGKVVFFWGGGSGSIFF